MSRDEKKWTLLLIWTWKWRMIAALCGINNSPLKNDNGSQWGSVSKSPHSKGPLKVRGIDCEGSKKPWTTLFFWGPFLTPVHMHTQTCMQTHNPESFSRHTDHWKTSKGKESNKAVGRWRLKRALHSKNLIYEGRAGLQWGRRYHGNPVNGEVEGGVWIRGLGMEEHRKATSNLSLLTSFHRGPELLPGWGIKVASQWRGQSPLHK